MIFLEYPKCSTCRKAKAWLDAHQINYTDRHIVEDNPSAAELAAWHQMSGLPLKKFFNTCIQNALFCFRNGSQDNRNVGCPFPHP